MIVEVKRKSAERLELKVEGISQKAEPKETGLDIRRTKT